MCGGCGELDRSGGRDGDNESPSRVSWLLIALFCCSNELIICFMREVKSFFRSLVCLACMRLRSFRNWSVSGCSVCCSPV